MLFLLFFCISMSIFSLPARSVSAQAGKWVLKLQVSLVKSLLPAVEVVVLGLQNLIML